MSNVNDILNGGGGAPSFSFPTIGTVAKGTIVATDVTQQRDPATGKPKVWPDGNPMMQAVLTLQTDQRDPAVENDDGQRRLFVKGQMRDAVREALRQAGVNGVELGGLIAVQYVSDKPSDRPGLNAAKQYAAQYKPPAANPAPANNLLGADAAPAAGVAPADLLG